MVKAFDAFAKYCTVLRAQFNTTPLGRARVPNNSTTNNFGQDQSSPVVPDNSVMNNSGVVVNLIGSVTGVCQTTSSIDFLYHRITKLGAKSYVNFINSAPSLGTPRRKPPAAAPQAVGKVQQRLALASAKTEGDGAEDGKHQSTPTVAAVGRRIRARANDDMNKDAGAHAENFLNHVWLARPPPPPSTHLLPARPRTKRGRRSPRPAATPQILAHLLALSGSGPALNFWKMNRYNRKYLQFTPNEPVIDVTSRPRIVVAVLPRGRRSIKTPTARPT
jgi:hypothetical protein